MSALLLLREAPASAARARVWMLASVVAVAPPKSRIERLGTASPPALCWGPFVVEGLGCMCCPLACNSATDTAISTGAMFMPELCKEVKDTVENDKKPSCQKIGDGIVDRGY